MKRILTVVAVLVSMAGVADENQLPSVDMAALRVNVTNWCIRASRSEQVWEAGRKMKAYYGLGDPEMTALLSGCMALFNGRTDYQQSYYHLYGLMQRTCGTNAAPVLAGIVRQNRDSTNVRLAYSAYCASLSMSTECFSLGCEVLDSDQYDVAVRREVFAQVARWRRLGELSEDGGLISRCNSFYSERATKDADFRTFVGFWRWPGQEGGQE